MKANGKLKETLKKSTLTETCDRIQQVCHERDRKSHDELVKCCQNGMKVGFKYRENLKENKVLAHSLHFCTPSEVSGQYLVKETKDAKKSSTVTVGSGVEWHGVKANIITCTCSYYKSTLMLCPCVCVVASRAEDLDIDNPLHVHPYYWIIFHPMFRLQYVP